MDVASESYSLENNKKMRPLSHLYIQIGAQGLPTAFLGILTDMEIRVATKYKHLGHTVIQFTSESLLHSKIRVSHGRFQDECEGVPTLKKLLMGNLDQIQVISSPFSISQCSGLIGGSSAIMPWRLMEDF